MKLGLPGRSQTEPKTFGEVDIVESGKWVLSNNKEWWFWKKRKSSICQNNLVQVLSAAYIFFKLINLVLQCDVQLEIVAKFLKKMQLQIFKFYVFVTRNPLLANVEMQI